MDRFEEKIENASFEHTKSFAKHKARMALTSGLKQQDPARAESGVLYQQKFPNLSTEELIEAIEYSVQRSKDELVGNSEQWVERCTLLEYDPIDFSIIDTDQSAQQSNSTLINSMSVAIQNIKNNKNGHLKKDQRSYEHPGIEGGDNTVLIGKVDDKFCLVIDGYEHVIISPLFDTLLSVTPDYIDVSFEGQRIRLSQGTITTTDYRRNDSYRAKNIDSHHEVPGFFDAQKSIRISLLTKDVDIAPEVLTEDDSNDEMFPHNEAHASFQSIQKAIVSFIKVQPATKELADQLRETEQALHLPTVPLDSQMYTLTLRTSDYADVLFFHNTTSRSNQETVTDAMFHMTTDEFLELAADDNRREQLLAEVLAETGFYFIRQHDGQIFLMDRQADTSSVITPDSPNFMDILHKVENKLAEYFVAIQHITPQNQSIRSYREILANEIEQEINKDLLKSRSIGRKFLDWFLGTTSES